MQTFHPHRFAITKPFAEHKKRDTRLSSVIVSVGKWNVHLRQHPKIVNARGKI